MQIKKQFVNNLTATYPGVNARKYITIHETGNRKVGADAQAHANLQLSGFGASWHWQVDDQVAIQSYPHTTKCWHAGDGRGTGNIMSIAIEICVNEDGDFKQAIQNAISLTKRIMKEENIPSNRVVQHHYWTGKNCPALLRSGEYGISWSIFKGQLEGEKINSSKEDIAASFGQRGKHIERLQNKLRKIGYTITVDGSFGPETLFAIRFFQARHQLVVDGIFGLKTNTMIENHQIEKVMMPIRVLQYGQVTEAVAVLQEAFNRLHIPLVVDHSFGPKTLTAVRTFQQENRLVIDGFVGPLTWAALHEKVFR